MHKSSSELRIDFTRLVKPTLVRVLNFVVIAYRNVKSYVRLVFTSAETGFFGYQHARLVHKKGTAPDTFVIAHAVTDDARDRERFFARLANEISKVPDCKDIDLSVIANDAQPVTAYFALARMFGRRINLQIFTNAKAQADGGNAVLHDVSPIRLSEKAVGCLRPPLLAKNTAREYLKSIDPIGRFCAISFPVDGRAVDVNSVLAEVAKRHADWRFVVLNDSIAFDVMPRPLPPAVLAPACAGFDFLTRLCLAIEADAYVGPPDVFGSTAYLAQRPAYLLESPKSPIVISTASPKPRWMLEDAYRVRVDEVERLASDLFGVNTIG